MLWMIVSAGVLTSDQGIITDRPDFTESSIVVEPRRLQLETGATYEWRSRSARSFAGAEVLFRYGLGNRIEARLGLPNYNWIDDESGRLTGFDDAYFGAKIQVGPFRNGLGLAFIPGVLLPMGRDGVRGDGAVAELKTCWSTDVGSYGLSGMIATAWPQTGSDRELQWMHTVSVGVPIDNKRAAFVESISEFSRSSPPAYILHGGVVYQPDGRSQWDAHIGVGLNRHAPRMFIGLGYSAKL